MDWQKYNSRVNIWTFENFKSGDRLSVQTFFDTNQSIFNPCTIAKPQNSQILSHVLVYGQKTERFCPIQDCFVQYQCIFDRCTGVYLKNGAVLAHAPVFGQKPVFF
jgi:hypothetical protein